MADSSGKPKMSLRIVVNKAKNKIVLVEAGKDFVDVLFGFFKLQMGTIVRLVNKQSQQTAVGCFSNIYKSVLNMKVDNFLTEACKHMLLYPTSLNDDIFPRLKVNIHDTIDESGKYFICPGYSNLNLCSEMWSSFSISKCTCGRKMEMVIEREGHEVAGDYVDDGGSVHGQPYAFIITDDMVVQSNCSDVFLKLVKDQGYLDADNLAYSSLLIGSEEVLTLLDCLFSSDTPLTDAFLLKQSSHNMKSLHKTLIPAPQGNRNEAESGLFSFKVLTLLDCLFTSDTPLTDAFLLKQGSRNVNKVHKTLSPALQVRVKFKVAALKQDQKVVYIECREDFVNLLFTFLAVSLEFVLETSGADMIQGCMVNLFRSFKDLSCSKKKTAETLPWYYSCQKKLLDVNTDNPPDLMFIVSRFGELRLIPWSEMYCALRLQDVSPVNPRCEHSDHPSIHCYACKGFVKGNMKFIVSDDLIITPMSSSSTIGYLEKLKVRLEDVYMQEMSIGKEEVKNVLRTSFMTSTVLTNAFGNFLVKNPNEEL